MTKLKHIDYAELHIYYPFYLDTTMSQRKLYKKILKSNLVCNQKYCNKTRESVSIYVNNIINDFNSETDDFHLKFSDENDIPHKTFFKPSKINLDYDDIEFTIGKNNDKINLSINSIELGEINKRMDQLKLEFNASETYYGENYINSQERFILKPFKVKLINNITVWGNAILILFSNNIGIVKLELPLINVKTKPLKENDFNQYIECIFFKDNKEILKFYSLQELRKKILSNIMDSIKCNILYYGNRLFNLLLIDYNKMPDNINNIPKSIQEELYRIVAAPIPYSPISSYQKQAVKYLKNHCINYPHVNYYIKSTGGCVSTLDTQLLSHISGQNRSMAESSNMINYELCKSIANEICINIEFSLILILLQRTINSQSFFEKVNTHHTFNKVKTNYYSNHIFLLQLQEECYASATEQLAAMQTMMPEYLKNDLSSAKIDAIDRILEIKESNINSTFQYFISICGLLLNLIFGLPAIKDTLIILHNYFGIANIKYITLDGASFIFWLLSNILIIIILLTLRHKIKK